MSNASADNLMQAIEHRTIAVLASAVSLRMVGLFMLLPVIAVFAEGLERATPLLVGMAVGCYGLTQAAFQIPLGMLSDRIGRKPVIVGGLLIFALGSVVASMADDIWVLIVGRLIQGAGAVSAASSALAADVTRESQRTKAMAIIGVTIGASFVLAIILGPAISPTLGVDGLLLVAAVMGILAASVIVIGVPTQTKINPSRGAWSLGALYRADLVRLDVGVFVLHAALAAIFVVLPQQLTIEGSEFNREWMVYLTALLLSFAILVPLLWKVDRSKGVKRLYQVAAGFAILGLVVLSQSTSIVVWWSGLAIFFVGFNFLEASMPSLLSKRSPTSNRGAAMGVFSSAQFLGTFFGGIMAGVLHGVFGPTAVYIACCLLMMVWMGFVTVAPPREFEA